jgi:hypothetical protein
VSQTEGQRMKRGLLKGVGSGAAMIWVYMVQCSRFKV